jgi:hypothetical protein
MFIADTPFSVLLSTSNCRLSPLHTACASVIHNLILFVVFPGSGDAGSDDAKVQAATAADAEFAVGLATSANAAVPAAAAPEAPKPKKKERLKGQARWAGSKKRKI